LETASPHSSVTPSPTSALTIPTSGPTATAAGTLTPTLTPTPGQVAGAIETYELPAPGEGQEVNGITAGPNGAVWFAWGSPSGSAGGIGSITAGGTISLFPLTSSDAGPVNDLAWGGGSIWTLEDLGGQSYVGQWTTGGTLQQQFPIPGVAAFRLVWGPDSALWFTAVATSSQIDPGGFIGWISASGVVTTYQLPASVAGQAPQSIVVGPDGALWFDVPAASSVGRITTPGTVSIYPIPQAMNEGTNQNMNALTVGSDDALWEIYWADDELVRISADGSMQEFPVPGCASTNMDDIASGPDGNLWLTMQSPNDSAVCTVSTDGIVTGVYPLTGTVAANTYPTVIAAGPTGDFWFGVVLGYIASLNPSLPSP
jgi:virginiamycin B lyase